MPRSVRWMLVMALSASGCSSGKLPLPTNPPTITGTITRVNQDYRRIHVERPFQPADSAHLAVYVARTTTVVRPDGRRGDLGSFAIGQRVRIWFIDDRPGSIPLGASARTVIAITAR
jgi:hypothetical protein